MTKSARILLPALVAALAPTAAFAHPGHDGWSFVAGLAHPLTGLDHLSAMVAVGFWAASLGGAARWATPSAFVVAMAIGAVFGIGGGPIVGFDLAIAMSVVALGFFIALDVRPPASLAVALVGVFALAHGFAHGAEAPTGAFAAFGAGFVITTAALHGVGLGLGALTLRFGPSLRRIAGASLAGAGFWFALAA